jgi:16S rRNA processing protein RimM
VVTGAHGVQGEVKVKSFTVEPSSVGAYGPLQTADGRGLLIISTRAARADEVILRLSGIDTRDAAEALKGQRLYVARSALPKPATGEFYHADLIGLRAETPEGQGLGVVSAVLNYGAGDILEITEQGGDTELIPFTDRHVPVVDFAGGRVIVDLPPADAE